MRLTLIKTLKNRRRAESIRRLLESDPKRESEHRVCVFYKLIAPYNKIY
jgi:hypothetical protein